MRRIILLLIALILIAGAAAADEPYVLIKCHSFQLNKIGYSTPDPGKVFLVTNLQIENHGYDEFYVNPTMSK